jgi:hypothetical protein
MRLLLLAVLALALAGAQQPDKQNHGATGGKQAGSAVAPPTPYAPYANKYSDACYGSKNHDTADLCAQWRAALAAEKATHEARRATTWAIAATFLSVVTVIGLTITIWQTFFALGHARLSNLIAQRANARSTRHTMRALDAADRQNEIAADTAKKQLRAYVATKPVGFVREPGGVRVFTGVANGGTTPAYELRIFPTGRIDVPNISPEAVKAIQEHAPASVESAIVLVSGQDIGREFGINVGEAEEAACRAGDRWLYFAGRIEYTDVFGDKHNTWFCHVYRGGDMSGVTYRHGNRAD